jgi:hypothetical protein
MFMRLDLTTLHDLHPRLSLWQAITYEQHAAHGLGRHGHVSGATLATRLDATPGNASLHWSQSAPSGLRQLDRHRITEEAAEAISLAVVGLGLGWTIHRRMQRGECGDWILHDRDERRVALEISGVDRGPCARRLRDKAAQVRDASGVDERAACVVELATPRAELVSGC